MKAKSVEKVLVTGGAGFIGSHTVDALAKSGYQVNILDNLDPQVHSKGTPEYLNENAAFVKGDLRDRDLLRRILPDVDAVIHLAATVGVGQSMYEVERYVDTNTLGTATLLQALINKEHSVRKLVVASSMSVYGEGKYHCEKCSSYAYPRLRSEEQLRKRVWDHLCPVCKSALSPVPTDESKPLTPTSIYAMSKRHQEETSLLIGETYGIRTTALRYFNVYGSRQALANPYTGVCAIFSSRILNGNRPYVFEDGNQSRDFIHVKDVARANLAALQRNGADFTPVNIGTGSPISIRRLAETLVALYGSNMRPYVSNEYRKGDIRHCYADISAARRLLEFEPTVSLQDGLIELIGWAKAERWGVVDLFEKTLEELREKELTA